jgi:hypothetical protein
MTSDFDDELQALFRRASPSLPGEAFTAAVTARIDAHRTRTRLLYGAGVLLTAVILWLLIPDLAMGVAALARLPDVVLAAASRAIGALSESSLLSVLYLYGGVLAGYLLLRVLHTFRTRWT